MRQKSYSWKGPSSRIGVGCVEKCINRASGDRVSSVLCFFLKFIYLFLAALGLRCCTQAFSSCGERGLLFVAVRGLLIVLASLVAEHGL